MRGQLSRRAVITGFAGGTLAASAGVAWAQTPPTMRPPGVHRLDPAFDALIDPNAQLEFIMDGFLISEGPVWVGGRDGHLLVSDVPANVIRRWSPKDGVSEFLKPSGYAGPPSPMFREAGANGLILARGGLVCADSGNRGIARIDLKTGRKTMLCRDFAGKRFNSPNDLVLARDGSIYFSDPPFGLNGGVKSPLRELDFTGVFRLAPDNTVTVVDRDIYLPNGVALSPDSRTLYSTSSGLGWVAWTLDERGRPSDKRMIVDVKTTGLGGGDGMKVDAAGNLWATSREGLSVFDSTGKRIGIVSTGAHISNCAFAADGNLYLTGGARVARIPVKARGIRI